MDIPGFEKLNLPPVLQEIVDLRNGIVLVTGPTGSGKSSTLAAILDKMNSEKAFHILTIEDPIEFLHKHKRATIHQRGYCWQPHRRSGSLYAPRCDRRPR